MTETTRRLFFALWPDRAARDALSRAASQAVAACAGRAVPEQNLHVTLLFLGSVVESRLADVMAIGSQVAGGAACAAAVVALQLEFNAVEFWKKSRLIVATAGAATVPSPSAADIAGTLTAAAVSAGLVTDAQSGGSLSQDFRPHVTLVRDARRAFEKRSIDAVTWSFRDFVLVESKTVAQGSIYTVLRTFPLGGEQP